MLCSGAAWYRIEHLLGCRSRTRTQRRHRCRRWSLATDSLSRHWARHHCHWGYVQRAWWNAQPTDTRPQTGRRSEMETDRQWL